MRAPVRLARSSGAELVAVVSVAPGAAPGTWLVRVARGKQAGRLSTGIVYGPYLAPELDARFDEAVAGLLSEGFARPGVHLLLGQLQDPRPKVRARTALRLGWMRSTQAVEALIARLPSSAGDVCSLLDALGEIADPRALQAVRPYAERKLLSRRRSAVEALRKLGADEALVTARALALARLPVGVREAVLAGDESRPSSAGSIVEAVLAEPPRSQGLAVDTLYELGTPATVAAARAVLRDRPVGAPGMWRYAKSVLKRAMLRHDHRTFGWLAYRIEREARSSGGTTAVVKSGYDGEERSTPIFRRRTQRFIQRLTWRYLRRLARWRPERYAHAAAEVLIWYRSDDAQKPHRLESEWSRAYLLHRILLGKSARFVFDARTMKLVFKSAKLIEPPPGAREEAFGDLWDAEPTAVVRLLARARLLEVHRFAHSILGRGQPHVIHSASWAELLKMLDAPFEPTVELALGELSRRFDPSAPSWELIQRLANDPRPLAQSLAARLLRVTAHLWTRDAERIATMLTTPPGEARSALMGLLIAALASAPRTLKEQLAERVHAVLVAPEPEPESKPESESAAGVHDGYVQLAVDGLAEELRARLTVEELRRWITSGSLAAQSIAGALLGDEADARALGPEALLALGEHPIAAVRAAAIRLARVTRDPAVLFALAESQWVDVRKGAAELLRGLALRGLGLERIMGLLDSTHEELQALGRELARAELSTLNVGELLARASEHPQKTVRAFAMELVEAKLAQGPEPLARLEPFFRTALLEHWPSRALKRKALAVLGARALHDERQAEVAARILRDVVRTAVKSDFDRIAQVLVSIKLAFPELETSLEIEPGGAH